MRAAARVSMMMTMVALAATAALAQTDPLAAKDPDAFCDGRIKVAKTVAPLRARPGDDVEIRIDVDVKQGFHVYAASSPFAAPALELKKGVTALELDGALASEPAPKIEDAPGLGTVHTLEKKARFIQKVKIRADAKPGPAKLAASLQIQACDENNCSPDEVPIAATIEIEPGASTPTPTPTPTPIPSPIPTPTPTPTTKAEPPGLGGLMLLAFVSGLLTLLLPCTYPMVPITISIFSKGKTLTRPQAAWRAAIYAGGIVVSFTLIGGVIQVLFASSGQAKINELATNGWVNLAIGAAFVYFAFSFFGYYDIGLPAPLQRLMERVSSGPRGDGGIPTASLFLMGLFFVLTSYTCGAPLVLGVIAQGAATPHKLAVVFATAVFGATVAAPFFFLALVPSFLKALPRGGGWFDAFKTVLGFCELAFAFKFIRTSDVAWELGIVTRPVLLGVWVFCCGLSVAYLLGWVKIVHEGEEPLERISLGRLSWAFAFAFAGIYLASGLGGRHLAGPIESFMLSSADASEQASTAPVENGPRAAYRFGKLGYGKDLDAALAAARASKRPVLAMFTGHT